MSKRKISLLLAMALGVTITGCSKSDSNSTISLSDGSAITTPTETGNTVSTTDNSTTTSNSTSGPKTYKISFNDDYNKNVQIALFEANDGDTIEFGEGEFKMPTGILIQGKRGVTIRGAGPDKTILNFKGSASSEGINASYMEGITIEDLAVLDTPGNGIRVYKSHYVTIKNVKAGWSDADPNQEGYQVSLQNGYYAIYPVYSRYLLIENTESYGSIDAGLYVGQSSDAIIRKNTAHHNVAGSETENVTRVLVEDNHFYNNTAGHLSYDLEGLQQYSDEVIIRNNLFENNNIKNFGVSGFIKELPRGVGALLVAIDRTDVYGNTFKGNKTTGLAILNYNYVNSKSKDLKIDLYTEGAHVYNNKFINNATELERWDPTRASTDITMLVVAKGKGRSANILTDGSAEKGLDTTCPMPVDINGIPLNQPAKEDEPWRFNNRLNDLGKPMFAQTDPNPKCRYNAWKYTADKKLKPRLRNCIVNNTFEGPNQDPILNGKLESGIDSPENFRAVGDRNIEAFKCTQPPVPIPVVNLPYKLPANVIRKPSEEETAKACSAAPTSTVNYALAERYNCPRLDQYGLFKDPSYPLDNPQGNGMHYELNSTLFTDHASKYRYIFIPPGKKAQFVDSNNEDNVAKPLDFPVGTIIAKTFTYRKEDASGKLLSEDILETRLLIKRPRVSATAKDVWVGLPYVWKKDSNGKMYATLQPEGDLKDVSYDFYDSDPEVKDQKGNRKRYTGTVKGYQVPSAMQCVTCHANEDVDTGSAPIGPKDRNLNRTNARLGGQNQLTYMSMNGLLEGLPTDISKVARMAKWNIPGDSGFAKNSPQDLQVRARAYLEINCASCHSTTGAAANTSLNLYSQLPLSTSDGGICKKPVAAGRGAGSLPYDVVPGKPGSSVLPYRLASIENGVRMPPIARTIQHPEAVELINSWIKVLNQAGNSDLPTCN